MARIHKVEMYLLDVNDTYGEFIGNDLECLFERSEFSPMFITNKPSKTFEWDDDIILNKRSRTEDDCKKFLE